MLALRSAPEGRPLCMPGVGLGRRGGGRGSEPRGEPVMQAGRVSAWGDRVSSETNVGGG